MDAGPRLVLAAARTARAPAWTTASYSCAFPARPSEILVRALKDRLKRIKKDHGAAELGKVDVNMVIGGMRGITVCPSPSRTI